MPRRPAIDAHLIDAHLIDAHLIEGRSDGAHQTSHAGGVGVSGADLVVSFHIRGPVGELEIDGTGSRALAPAVVEALDTIRTTHPDVAFHLAADHPIDALDGLPEAVADRAGLPHRRDLLQLRRPLPIPADHPTRLAAPALSTRPIELTPPGEGRSAAPEPPRPDPDGSTVEPALASPDVAAWLRVNNRAFAHHPDQGAESVETLAERLGPEWHDPSGFLVADDPARPGELSGFCWTKLHPATETDPALGEIYVIGVDPSQRGAGLGPSFVLAGLDHLVGGGISTAMLYVDADNEPARRLYDRLDFAIHRRRRVYSPTSEPPTVNEHLQ